MGIQRRFPPKYVETALFRLSRARVLTKIETIVVSPPYENCLTSFSQLQENLFRHKLMTSTQIDLKQQYSGNTVQPTLGSVSERDACA